MDDQDLARIRLVTRRYHEMQGLGRIALGVGFVAGSLVADHVIHAGGSPWAFLLPVAAAASIAIPGKLTSDQLYERRFGRVRKASDADEGGRRGLFLGVAFAAAMIVEEQLPAGSPGVLFLVLAIMPVRSFVRDWPFRKYVAVEAIAAIAASLLCVTPDPSLTRDAYRDLQTAAWWNGFGLVGTAAIITGMLDHRLLTSTLKGQPAGDRECQHVGPL